jgi:ferric-dicitrate binding protein FerR (iron transport regulator)
MNRITEELIFRFLNGELGLEEMKELDKWMRSSSENMELFEACRRIWLGTAAGMKGKEFNHETAWASVQERLGAGGSGKPERLVHHHSMKNILRIAAMFIIFVSIGAAISRVLFKPSTVQSADTFSEIIAPPGSKSLITLPDGSKAWINAGSKLVYRGDFNLTERIVDLEGEGYFDVTSNKSKPFIVRTAHLKVKAYGTVFNVKAYPEENTVETTLVEGLVEVETDNKMSRETGQTYTLKPNQNIIYHIDSGLAENTTEKKEETVAEVKKAEIVQKAVQVVSNIKPELYTSWKDENWVIEGLPLDELAVLMGRRYNSRIDIRDETLKFYKFTGTIQNETLEQMLVILSLTTPLEYSIGKGNVSLTLNRNMEKNYSRILKR